MEIHTKDNLISVEAILLKTTPAGRIFFAQDRIALVDDDNTIINSIDILDQIQLLTA